MWREHADREHATYLHRVKKKKKGVGVGGGGGGGGLEEREKKKRGDRSSTVTGIYACDDLDLIEDWLL